jgi:SWI/SNF-related matrix-associated actin-dependent regulator 1 of chromatin subfamily A
MMPEKFWNFFTYAQEFCGAYKSRWGWDFSGSSNEEKLQVILRQNIMIRRLKKDVMKELPPKIRQVIELSSAGFESIIRNEKDTYENMSEEQKILTLEAELALAEENEVRYQEIVARLREVNGILFSEMSELRKKTALAKLPQCIDYIKDMLESVDKLVVFAHHHEVIDGLMAEFGEIAVKIDGRVSTTKRQEPVDRFQNDPKVRMFIGNMTAAGVGITLTAASNVVFCELAWNPGDLSQAEDRCHRKGQQENVYVVHLVFQDSLDCNMAKKLVDKQNVIDGIFNREVEDLDTSTYTSIEEARRASEGISDPKIRELVLSGLREVVMGCDGAAARDDHGFNKIDARIGRDLAGRYSLSPKQAALGKKILRKYRRQVSSQVYEGIYGKG